MLTHFLHHVTLIRWTLLAQELNTLRSRAAVTSQPASCFFREAQPCDWHLWGWESRWAAQTSEPHTIEYRRLIMMACKWYGLLSREHTCTACNLDTWNAQVFTSVSLSSRNETWWGLCVKVFSQMSQRVFLRLKFSDKFTSISPLRYSLRPFHNGGASHCRLGDRAAVCKWGRRLNTD